jgi:hypothetical protein
VNIVNDDYMTDIAQIFEEHRLELQDMVSKAYGIPGRIMDLTSNNLSDTMNGDIILQQVGVRNPAEEGQSGKAAESQTDEKTRNASKASG